MKYKSYFLIIVFLFAVSFVAKAQDNQMQIREYYENKSLKLLLFDLSMNYNIDFQYDPADIQGIKIDMINIKGLDLETTMKALLKKTKLQFSIPDPKTVIIKPYVKEARVSMASKRSNIEVAGWIFDKSTNETLPYATAAVPGTSMGSIANVDGHFLLMDVPSDTSTLKVSFLGYETKSVKLTPVIAEENIYV